MAHTNPTIGQADWGDELNTALDDIDDTAIAAQTTADGKADASHTHAESDVTGLVSDLAGKADAVHAHAASDVTSGTLSVSRGGTGLSSVSSGNFLSGNGTLAMSSRTPTQVRSDIGADNASNLTSGTVAFARLPTGTTSSTVAVGNHTHAASDIASGTVDIARLPASLPRGIMADPIGTTSNGTATSGTTETRDAVLGDYTFTATAGRRYKVILSGRAMNTNTALERYEFRIRMTTDGTTPDATDTCVATAQAYLHENSNIGRMSAHLEGTFTASGTCKLACFMVRLDGTGFGTPVSTGVAGVGAELWVEDIGPS